MKRILALLFSIALMLSLLSGCDLLSGTELADPDPEIEHQEETEPEPIGSKAVTLIFAYAEDDGRTDLLEAATQIADAKGYTLSAVESLGNPELQNRFIELARDAGEQAILVELADPSRADDAVEAAGDMAVIFIDTAPDSNSVLGKRVIFVGNPDGEGELYLRLTGRTAMRAADNLIRDVAADEETELKLSGHKIHIPADGVLEP